MWIRADPDRDRVARWWLAFALLVGLLLWIALVDVGMRAYDTFVG
jgi:hypothetical protein